VKHFGESSDTTTAAIRAGVINDFTAVKKKVALAHACTGTLSTVDLHIKVAFL
jgi:hypothetical protein